MVRFIHSKRFLAFQHKWSSWSYFHWNGIFTGYVGLKWIFSWPSSSETWLWYLPKTITRTWFQNTGTIVHLKVNLLKPSSYMSVSAIWKNVNSCLVRATLGSIWASGVIILVLLIKWFMVAIVLVAQDAVFVNIHFTKQTILNVAMKKYLTEIKNILPY